MTSFLDRVKKSRDGNVWLLRTTDAQARACYFYIRVDPLKKAILENRIGQSGLTITDYGEIITSGFGENPPLAVAQRMKDEYGFEA